MRGQSRVGEAGGAAQAELQSMHDGGGGRGAGEEAHGTQAREAQAICESLEAVARGRYPLRARAEVGRAAG
eukprot:4702745-Prymnesium_polylepis.1